MAFGYGMNRMGMGMGMMQPMGGFGGSQMMGAMGLGLGLGIGLGMGMAESSQLSPEASQMGQMGQMGQQMGMGNQQQEMMMLMMMLMQLMMEMNGQGQGGNPYGNQFGGSPFGGSPFGGSPFGGSPLGGSPFGGFPGSFPGFPMGGQQSYGGSPYGGYNGGSTNYNTPGATGNPSQAVQIANQFMGKGSGSFTFANYSHAGGSGNDCADFVSACVADAGTFHKTGADANVGNFQNDLAKQGWHQTTNPQPGDVAIVNGSQHAELVSGPGGQCIGSNGGATNQSISHDTPSKWGRVVYWAPPQGQGQQN